MALDPLELMVIAAMGIVIFLWGPEKIPEIARSLGRARKEFNAVTKDFQQGTGGVSSPISLIDRLMADPGAAEKGQQGEPQSPQPVAVSTPATRSADEVLIETARKLGLATEGKTRDEISQEIINKKSVAAPSPEPASNGVPPSSAPSPEPAANEAPPSPATSPEPAANDAAQSPPPASPPSDGDQAPPPSPA